MSMEGLILADCKQRIKKLQQTQKFIENLMNAQHGEARVIKFKRYSEKEGGKEMRELSTIQKREKLNNVYAMDEKGSGGENHKYHILNSEWDKEHGGNEVLLTIQFQNGARKEENSIHGVLDADLLEIVRDRLKAFQAGPFASNENDCAIYALETCLMWMNRRVEDRIERNVLGTMNK